MILHLNKDIPKGEVEEIAKELKALFFHDGEKYVLTNSFRSKKVPSNYESLVDEQFEFSSDIQLANRQYIDDTRSFKIDDILVGSDNTLLITGPCSVESESQIMQCAEFVSGLGLKVLRAGCFKPRTSPYTFQGLGKPGLELLGQVRKEYDLKIISEVRDASHVEEVIEMVDIIQIGAKAMYDQGILRKCGKANKPVLLKRGFGTTLQEFVQAAEFILSLGNPRVVLCERGIRTFENKTRFTLDLCGVAYLKKHVNLPIFLDPSHAMGYSYGVPDLTKACVAMGVDGLLIESHPNPEAALSDASQQLDFPTFQDLLSSLKPIAKTVNKNLI